MIQLTSVEIEKKKLKAIIENIKEGVVIIDKEGNISLFNKAAQEITGYLEGEAIGMPASQILKFFSEEGEITFDLYCPAVEFSREGLVFDRQNIKIITKDNENKIVNVKTRRIKEGHEVGLGCILTIESTFEKAELERMKLDFTAMATHVLRTPATVLRGYLAKLLEEKTISKLDTDEIDWLNHAVAGADELKAQIENLLNLSEVFEGKFSLNVVALNIEEVVKRMVEFYLPSALDKGLSLTFVPPIYRMPRVMANITRLEEVLANLIENAVKFTDTGKIEVKIGKDESDRYIVVSIKDTGRGIPKQYLSHIFTKFFRVKQALEMVPGNGLGLYVTKKIVDSWGGKIWVESTEGVGSEFFFTIPIEEKK